MRVVCGLPDGSCEAAMTFASKVARAGWCFRIRRRRAGARTASLADRVRETAGAALAAYARNSTTEPNCDVGADSCAPPWGSIERLLEGN